MAVRKRKDTGKWITDFRYNGQRIVQTLKFARTRSEAEQAEAVIMTKVFQQAYGLAPKEDTLLTDFVVDHFLPYSEANKKSFRCDVIICKVLVKYFKKKGLRQITPGMIETFKQEFLATPVIYGPEDDRKERPRKPATVNYHLRVLSKILSMAFDAELIDNNPARKVKVLPLNNQRTRVLSKTEEKALLKKLDGNPVKDLVIFALHTGMRKGEIFNLEWKDIDFDRGTILIQESKSGKKRHVYMNAVIVALLQGLPRNKFVFTNPKTGDKYADIKKSFNAAADGLDLHFHDLRHTAATRMADAGADAFTLMKILGHSDIRMTSRYTHATDTALRRAVDGLVATQSP